MDEKQTDREMGDEQKGGEINIERDNKADTQQGRQKVKNVHRRKAQKTVRHTKRQTVRQRDRQTRRKTDRQKNRQANRWKK